MTVLVNDVDDVIIFADVHKSEKNDVKSYKYPSNTYFDQIGAPQQFFFRTQLDFSF